MNITEEEKEVIRSLATAETTTKQKEKNLKLKTDATDSPRIVMPSAAGGGRLFFVERTEDNSFVLYTPRL